ncbi:major histocompatibility complex class I-related gene protein-like isoform X1 [Hippocampus comes]|uniref:Major histocompatibility complex class I ZAA n=1 Tax=Hippocampus comes TaxID=109280 RepID=A0A3Q3DVR3_HIPCM|nr:PREDICTED: major histocompatibility complex class I-related gene protein-like isoform X1 [Hippocampus comes]
MWRATLWSSVKMFVLVFVLCFGFGAPMIANDETHTLTYIYTQLSGGESLPAGVYDFSAMGVLDGHVIDYYDSGTMKKVPKHPWMSKELSATYWEQGTQSRRSKQQWFKVNVDILLERMGHNWSDVHVLQWLHGCHGDLHPNGTVGFRGAVDTYSYDGLDFLSFDYKHAEWVATAPAALETKRKWDGVALLKDYTRAYLNKECITWMERFLGYRRNHRQRTPPPSVDMIGRKARAPGTLLLTCLASGFPLKDVVLEIRRNGRTLAREDGVTSSGVRPNEDDTFQRRDSVEVLASDTAQFTCVLRHRATGLHMETLWDGKILSAPAADVVGGFIAGCGSVAVLAAALGWFLRRKFKGAPDKASDRADRLQQFNSKQGLLPLAADRSLDSDASSGSAATSQYSLTADAGGQPH